MFRWPALELAVSSLDDDTGKLIDADIFEAIFFNMVVPDCVRLSSPAALVARKVRSRRRHMFRLRPFCFSYAPVFIGSAKYIGIGAASDAPRLSETILLVSPDGRPALLRRAAQLLERARQPV
ncbi:hypothetical protein Busp01_11060 [Trinickia caryophylli]|nr:hypothetical protein Busp01_11060 [Trinickia caryophylli]